MPALRVNAEDVPEICDANCAHCEAPIDAGCDPWIRVFAIIETISARRGSITRYWHPRCYGSRQHFLPQPKTNALAARS
jgi:hypothetical protein